MKRFYRNVFKIDNFVHLMDSSNIIEGEFLPDSQSENVKTKFKFIETKDKLEKTSLKIKNNTIITEYQKTRQLFGMPKKSKLNTTKNVYIFTYLNTILKTIKETKENTSYQLVRLYNINEIVENLIIAYL